MNRLNGIDLARGFAFLGMVIVNYRVILGWAASEPSWLRDFLEKFTSRAAPLFVLIAGVGTTLLFRAGMFRKQQGTVKASLAGSLLRGAFLGVVLAAFALVVDYNRWTDFNDERSLSLAKVINGWIDDDPKVVEQLPERIGEYRDELAAGTTDRRLLYWMGGGIIACLALAVLLRRDPRGSLIARAGFLLALGFAWHPLWSGDILHYYGVLLLAGAALVAAPWWVIVGALAATLVTRPYLRAGHGWSDFEGWSMALEYGEFWEFEGQARNLFYNGWHPVFPWLGFFIVGLLVGRMAVGRWGPQVVLLILGVALWQGTRYAAPATERGLRDAARAQVAAIGAREDASLEGLRLVLGPPSERPRLIPEEGTRRRRSRGPKVETVIGENLGEGSETRSLIRATKRVARALGRADRPPYKSWSLRLDPGAEDGAHRLLLDVAYDPGAAAPADHERHREHAIAALAGLVNPPRNMMRAMGGGLLRWPASVKQIGVRRFLTYEDTKTGALRSDAADTTWLSVDEVRDVSPTLTRLADQCGTSSFMPGPFYFTSALGTALMVLALSLMAAQFAVVLKVLHPVVCAGQMALTLYVAHVLIGLTAIEALDYKKSLSRDLPGIACCIVVCWLVSLGFAAWWRSFAKRGPLEMIMRTICR